jgi:hypothetical protein
VEEIVICIIFVYTFNFYSKLMMVNRKYSENDELFFELLGYYPTKAGEAYEILSTAAYDIAARADSSSLDNYVTGMSGAVHQLDGRLMVEDKDVMLEAKDYTRKIGLGKLREFQGGLTDLPVDRGVYAAPSSYSKPAKKYAAGTSENPMHKSITLLDVRKSIKEDLHGRIQSLILSFRVPPIPEYDKMVYALDFDDQVKSNMLEEGLSFPCRGYVTDENKTILNLGALLSEQITNDLNQLQTAPKDRQILSGTVSQELFFWGKNDKLYPVTIEYSVPLFVYDSSIRIEPKGKPVIYIKSDDNSINKLITDTEIIEWAKKKGLDSSQLEQTKS